MDLAKLLIDAANVVVASFAAWVAYKSLKKRR